MTRVLVTADTHAPRRVLPDWLLDRAAQADLIVHAGDLCDGSALWALAALAPTYAVRGNNDVVPLPERLTLDIDGVRIGIVHGDAGPGRTTPERARRAFDDPLDVVVFGHSHERLWEQVEGVWLLNPGSPTKPRGGPASAAWLTCVGGAVGIAFLDGD